MRWSASPERRALLGQRGRPGRDGLPEGSETAEGLPFRIADIATDGMPATGPRSWNERGPVAGHLRSSRLRGGAGSDGAPPRRSRGGGTGRTIPLLVLGLLSLAACDGGEPAQDSATVATKSDADVPTWLSHTDAMEPARWLAAREPGQPASGVAARSEHLRHSLARARTAFIEDPRMVANRTVQLGQMLAESGRPESYADLLDGLEAVADRTRRKQLYGEMCQHYYNTRLQGADRTEALARLTERYAAQAPDTRDTR